MKRLIGTIEVITPLFYFPPGGTEGQLIIKNSQENYDMSWGGKNVNLGEDYYIIAKNTIPTGGNPGQALLKNTSDDYDFSWTDVLTAVRWDTITGDQTLIKLSGFNDDLSYEVPLTFSTGLNRTGNTITNTITQYTDTDAISAIKSDPDWNSDNWDTAYGWGNHSIAGYVKGPESSVNDRVAFFDGTTGKLVKDSGLTLSGTNTGDQDLSGLVPYKGAINGVDLGNNTIKLDKDGSTGLMKHTTSTGEISYITDNSDNWNTAYSWGNHSTAGYADITGTPADNQFAIWTDANTIEGDSNLKKTNLYLDPTTIPSGAGTRMMWIPSKSAFRVGAVSGTQWDENNIGNYSIGIGYDSTAKLDRSIAIGQGTATGTNSIAIGNTSAQGYNSISLGSANSLASGSQSISIGNAAKASNSQAISIGFNSQANGLASVAIGNRSFAEGENSLSLGSFSYSFGSSSMATGVSTLANGDKSLSTGYYSVTRNTGFISQNTSRINTPRDTNCQFGLVNSLEIDPLDVGFLLANNVVNEELIIPINSTCAVNITYVVRCVLPDDTPLSAVYSYLYVIQNKDEVISILSSIQLHNPYDPYGLIDYIDLYDNNYGGVTIEIGNNYDKPIGVVARVISIENMFIPKPATS